MKVPYSWLNTLLPLNMTANELSSRLTMRGIEVEAIEEIRPHFDGVVAAEVISMDVHPLLTNLYVCMVDTGKEVYKVVCGAKNVSPKRIVPLAIKGARLADGTMIDKREIGGVTSEGMLCSERELGLTDDHSGIFILPEEIKKGTLLNAVEPFNDHILDINVPPNRGDCLSIYGIAREVGSIVGKRPTIPSFEEEDQDMEIDRLIDLKVIDEEACPRYVLRMLKGATICPSPYLIRERLIKCGMRPINSIVDVTNYVMLELGQPLHAFDYHRLEGKRIEVRLASSEIIFRTLDGVDRVIVGNDLLICDGNGPVAIAGIMGGENSEITEKTRDVALESAYFNPLFIRKTARRLGIRSEASLRFEKGIDIERVDIAARRAIELMKAISGGTIVKGKKEIWKKAEPKRIFVSYNKINAILGVAIDPKDAVNALNSIDIEVEKEEEDGLSCSVPLFRHDIEEYIDLIEEIARIYGFEHIYPTTPSSTAITSKREKSIRFYTALKEYFKAAGFFEAINFAFLSQQDLDNLRITPSHPLSSSVAIINPISRDYSLMRTLIAASVLKNIAYNLNRGQKNLRIYEIGKVFIGKKKGATEYPSVFFAITGKEREYFWKGPIPEYDFFDIKGILEGLFASFNIGFSLKRDKIPFLHNGSSAEVIVNDKGIGWIGEVREDVLRPYDIEQKVYCAEIRLDLIIEMGVMVPKYRPIPRYPQVIRDFSFYIDDDIPISTVIDRIKKVSPLIVDVGVFDMFKREKRSVSFRVVFQSFEDTLKDETINGLQDIIIRELTGIKGIKLRT